jgi:hypothetical protein
MNVIVSTGAKEVSTGANEKKAQPSIHAAYRTPPSVSMGCGVIQPPKPEALPRFERYALAYPPLRSARPSAA